MKFNPTMHKLSNGITVILDPMDVATDELCICFKTGASDEKPNEYGITHFCEHMIDKGTPRFPTPRIGDDYIAEHGGYTNAITSMDCLRFTGRIVAKNLMILLDFWADKLKNALFDESVIENERGVILDELRRRLSDNDIKAQIFAYEKLLGLNVPKGKVILGSPENIKRFKHADFVKFVSKRMSAENCLICISGKIQNKKKLLTDLEKMFNFLPMHDVKNYNPLTYRAHFAHNYIPDTKNVVIEFLLPALWNHKTPNFDKKESCVSMFENCLHEKLFDILRSENGLTYGVSRTWYGNMNTQLPGFRTETSSNNVARVVELFAKTAYRVYTKNLPTADYLHKYTNELQLSRANFLESNSNRCDRLVLDWVHFNRLNDFYEQCRIMDSVTVKDVFKYTRGYFDGPISIITHGPKFNANVKQIWKENFK